MGRKRRHVQRAKVRQVLVRDPNATAMLGSTAIGALRAQGLDVGPIRVGARQAVHYDKNERRRPLVELVPRGTTAWEARAYPGLPRGWAADHFEPFLREIEAVLQENELVKESQRASVLGGRLRQILDRMEGAPVRTISSDEAEWTSRKLRGPRGWVIPGGAPGLRQQR